jgi:hypothetical protein
MYVWADLAKVMNDLVKDASSVDFKISVTMAFERRPSTCLIRLLSY